MYYSTYLLMVASHGQANLDSEEGESLQPESQSWIG